MKTEMMAAVLYGKEHLEVEPVDVPKIDKGDVLVRVRAALTCGTDVKVFRRGYHARMIVPPALFGHELAGDIVAVGDDVKGFRVGQRVVAANSAPCLECYYCKRGLENLCEDLLFNNGAYAEYIRIPARIVKRNMYEIPAHVSYQDAALIEPLACVMRGLEETHVRPGDTRCGDRSGSDRTDVRAAGEDIRSARHRDRAGGRRSWNARPAWARKSC